MEMVHSFKELPDFPYPTYPDFAEAVGQGRALVWVRPDIGAAWRLGSAADRAAYSVLMGAGLVFAVLFAVFAYRQHNAWLLLGSAASLVGYWFMTPNINMIEGCLPYMVFIASLIAIPFAGPNYMPIGFASVASWFMGCAGLGIADGTIREAMVKSEEMFLWLWERRAVVRVERKNVDPEV